MQEGERPPAIFDFLRTKKTRPQLKFDGDSPGESSFGLLLSSSAPRRFDSLDLLHFLLEIADVVAVLDQSIFLVFAFRQSLRDFM